jgi:hypothetical protein
MRFPTRILLVVLAVLIATPDFARAQDASVADGARIRVRSSASSSWITGNYLGSKDDRIRIQPSSGMPQLVSMSSIANLEVSSGKQANIGKGALYGLGVGAIAGLVAIMVDDQGEDASGDYIGNDLDVMVVPAFALLGAGAGALVGAFWTTERWVSVPKTSLSIGPMPGVAPMTVVLEFQLGNP